MNPFESDEQVEAQELDEAVAAEVEDLDVDSGTADADEADEVPAEAQGAEKPAKAAKAPARPPVPEGFVTPVAFAKILTEHLAKKGVANKNGPIDPKTNPVPPQMVYSYINNSQKGKNPFPTYEEGGRVNLVKPEEGLKWWDEKDARTAERSANAKAKAEKKAAAAAKPTEGEAATEGPVEEAE